MNKNSFDQRLVFDPDQVRYYELLREAEQYWSEQGAVRTSPANSKTTRRFLSLIAHLLVWTKSFIVS